MTKDEEKQYLKMIPRFREVCCKKLCSFYDTCINKTDESLLGCPWFFGYRMEGWPVKRLSDYSYNAPIFPDLREEEANQEIVDYFLNRKNKSEK